MCDMLLLRLPIIHWRKLKHFFQSWSVIDLVKFACPIDLISEWPVAVWSDLFILRFILSEIWWIWPSNRNCLLIHFSYSFVVVVLWFFHFESAMMQCAIFNVRFRYMNACALCLHVCMRPVNFLIVQWNTTRTMTPWTSSRLFIHNNRHTLIECV